MRGASISRWSRKWSRQRRLTQRHGEEPNKATSMVWRKSLRLEQCDFGSNTDQSLDATLIRQGSKHVQIVLQCYPQTLLRRGGMMQRAPTIYPIYRRASQTNSAHRLGKNPNHTTIFPISSRITVFSLLGPPRARLAHTLQDRTSP